MYYRITRSAVLNGLGGSMVVSGQHSGDRFTGDPASLACDNIHDIIEVTRCCNIHLFFTVTRTFTIELHHAKIHLYNFVIVIPKEGFKEGFARPHNPSFGMTLTIKVETVFITKNAGHSLGKSGHDRQISINRVSRNGVDLSCLH